MKINYPVKYALMPIIEQVGWTHGLHELERDYDVVYYVVSKCYLINDTKKSGGRIISVGTTSTRVLETLADENGFVHEATGWTDIFLYPPYKFRCPDCLITNFHLPESTLLMLVSAFSSKEIIMKAYKEAVDEKYRFFSFGDAMFLK